MQDDTSRGRPRGQARQTRAALSRSVYGVPAGDGRRGRPASVVSQGTRPRETLVACLGLVALTGLPVAIWHDLIAEIAARFQWQLGYLVTEWGPWLILASGVAFLIPVALSSGRRPGSRLYPRARRAYLAWGLVLYLLGTALATQLGQVAALSS